MHRVLFAALAIALFVANTTFAARFTSDVVAIEGQLIPDGNNFFLRFDGPVLNDRGQVSFKALLEGRSDNQGIFRGDGELLLQIVREGQQTPDGVSVVSYIYPRETIFSLNSNGDVAFYASMRAFDGIFKSDGLTITEIAREGQTLPNGNGSFSGFQIDPDMNDAGQVAFVDRRGVFVGDGTTLREIARVGNDAPDGNGSFIHFDSAMLNEAGQVAFTGFLGGTSAPQGENGIFLGDGDTLTQIVRVSQPAPDGNGSFTASGIAAINNAGQVAFYGRTGATDDGIYLSDGSSLIEIVGEAQPAPDGNGEFYTFNDVSLNNAGQVAFRGGLGRTSGGGTDDFGIFRTDGHTLVQIAREGQAVPDGNGRFHWFWSTALNDSGDVLFTATLTDTAYGEADGIYFFSDRLGLQKVAREGDPFLGSAVRKLSLSNDIFGNWSSKRVLSNRRQVAYWFQLDDGREGIAIATLIPEPSSLTLLSLICLAALSSRRAAKPQRW